MSSNNSYSESHLERVGINVKRQLLASNAMASKAIQLGIQDAEVIELLDRFINELDRSLLEHILADLEKEYQADPANELAISLGRKSRYELLLDKIKNSKINITSTSSFCNFESPEMWKPKL